MDDKNYFADALEIGKNRAMYDACAKVVLADKQVLARILQGVTTEFAEYTIDDIIDCIEPDISISETPIIPGKTAPEAIYGMNVEDKIPNEGELRFDILFTACTKEKIPVKLHINLEAQNDFKPSPPYDMVTRSIVYGARLLSRQVGKEFCPPHYDDVKKVYSIWICKNCPKEIRNTITKFHVAKEDLYGVFDYPARYDLMEIIFLCLDKKKNSEQKLLSMLETIFSSELSVDEKKDTLSIDYGFSLKREGKEALDSMCNLSQGLIDEGIEKGLRQGRDEGEINMLLRIVKSLVSQKGMSVQDAMDYVDAPADKRETILQMLQV